MHIRTIALIRSALLAVMILAVPAGLSAQFAVSITIGPPALPIYEQPPIPTDGYLWTPGYWSYTSNDYYWVPGTWVIAPSFGLLWTPGYWNLVDTFHQQSDVISGALAIDEKGRSSIHSK